MIALPKLLLVALVIFAVWYAVRWVNRVRPPVPPRRPMQSRAPGPMIEAEDLVACGVCGTYLPVSARDCGRAGCPRPR